MKDNTPHQRGFTLIELLLYVAIVSTLLGALATFFSLSLSARVKNQSIAEVNQQGAAILERFATTVRAANGITSPTAGTTASSLTLAVTTPALTPTIFDASSGSPAAFQIKEGGASAIPLTNNKVALSDLSFKNLSRASTPGAIQISFTLSRVNSSGRNEYDYQKTFTTTVALR